MQNEGAIDKHRGERWYIHYIRYNVLTKEDPIDYTLNVYFSTDGSDGFIKLVNELFEAYSIFSFREDRV
jgi:hypothetical protein